VPKDNVEALASAMSRVINEPGLAAKLIAGGRAAYEAQFTKAAFLRDSLAFYNRVIPGN
jgi:glycosyltransferase involved in cell wall biosynthesis